MKKRKKLLALLCAAALMQCLFTVPSFAYFNRGTVSMQLGQSSINLAARQLLFLNRIYRYRHRCALSGCEIDT